MITLTSAQLNAWVAAFLWPLTRILGLIAAAPVFNSLDVPATIKVALGILIALIVAPSVPAIPATDPISLAGMMILTQQLVIGLAMGFAMRIAFSAVELAGELTGLTMGFGFATFFDPQSQGRSSAINQLLSLMVLMIYLVANFHLMILSALVDSFTTLPIASAPMGGGPFRHLVSWGGVIFSAGMQLSLPIVAALLINNIALGILTRAAPQLNLFGIGFPIALGVGFIMIAISLPYLAAPMERLLQEGLGMMRQLGGAH
jgi:flagellar biosynthetic protein FliR